MKTITISQWVAAAVNPARGVHAASTSKRPHAAELIPMLSAIRELKRTEVRAPLLALAVLFFTFTTFAQVSLPIGTLPPGATVTITFDVTINSNSFPLNTFSVTNQGSVSATGIATVLTDDPAVGGAADPTVTPLPADLDFGDAPAPYPTLLANNGARHVIPFTGATLFLGTVPPDAESDGQPNATATGDNLAGVNDEDGVTFPASFRGGLSSNITVTASAAGVLNAWIDWNQDGDWNDAGEQICVNQAVIAGPNVIAILAPGSSTVTAGSFARFRLSSQSDLLLTGQAPDGEVEDHAVTLVANTPPVGGSHSVTTRTNLPLVISINKLLAGASDADGDSLSITGVAAALPAGATVSLGSTTITYTPPATAGAGSFAYTLSDGRGGTATVTVSVTITDSASGGVSPNVVYGPTIDTVPDPDEFVVRFAGHPGTSYTIEFSTNANGPWTKKVNKTAPTDNAAGFGIGVFEFREPIGTSGFYRTVYPSY